MEQGLILDIPHCAGYKLLSLSLDGILSQKKRMGYEQSYSHN